MLLFWGTFLPLRPPLAAPPLLSLPSPPCPPGITSRSRRGCAAFSVNSQSNGFTLAGPRSPLQLPTSLSSRESSRRHEWAPLWATVCHQGPYLGPPDLLAHPSGLGTGQQALVIRHGGDSAGGCCVLSTASDTRNRKASTHQSPRSGRCPGHSQREVPPGESWRAPGTSQRAGRGHNPAARGRQAPVPSTWLLSILWAQKCPDCPGKSQAA